MEGYTQVRCLFCLAGHEAGIARAVKDGGLGTALYPMRVKRLFCHGVWESVSVPMLPGYVFVYSRDDGSDVSTQIALKKIRNVIRVLRYTTDDDSDVLAGQDRRFADWLWEHDGTIGVLEAVKVGERVEIVDGLFKAFHGKVTKMDRRKQMARVELDILGGSKFIWLSYECLKEQKDEAGPTPPAQN